MLVYTNIAAGLGGNKIVPVYDYFLALLRLDDRDLKVVKTRPPIPVSTELLAGL